MKNKTTIEIDLAIYKLIVQHSKYINEPPTDVLKRLLKIESNPMVSKSKILRETNSGLIVKGILLPNGLQLRSQFKGKLFEAVIKNGFLEYNKMKYTSPSGAAVNAAGNSVNGWRFWEYYDEESGKWKILENLRNK